jgi:hypothetical protein
MKEKNEVSGFLLAMLPNMEKLGGICYYFPIPFQLPGGLYEML